jgi:hypothetical protein
LADCKVSGQLHDGSRDCARDRRIGQIQRNPQSIVLMECFEGEIGVSKLDD